MNISVSTFRPTRRRLKKIEEEENASTLQLGHEFQLTQINHQGVEEQLITLNLSEARLVIKEALIERRKAFRREQLGPRKKRRKRNQGGDNNGRDGSGTDKDHGTIGRNDNDSDGAVGASGADDNSSEDDSESDIEEEKELLRAETREKELQSIDRLLEQTTTGNNKDLKNTMEYLTNFSRFRDQETVAAVIQLLKGTGLHPFEIAQLGTLACDTADEAKTIIPSLNNKISDDELERLLKELSNLETLY